MSFEPQVADTGPYPVRVAVERADKLSRLSTAFRVILAIPIVLFLSLFGFFVVAAIAAATWATILVRGRIPHWLFDFQVALNRFQVRTTAYVLLLTDKYPAFEGDWVAQYDVDYPQRLSRWKVLLWKIITSLPHLVVLAFLWIAVGFVTFIAWWAILFTGSYPKGLHTFVVGVLRWSSRVTAYFTSLTDEFPPYSLDENASATGGQAVAALLGGVLLALIIGGGTAGGIALYKYSNESKTSQVDYADAAAGSLSPAEATIRLDNVVFELVRIEEDWTIKILKAPPGSHIVVAYVTFADLRYLESQADDVEIGTLRLKTDDDGVIKPVLLTADGIGAPLEVLGGDSVELAAYFEVADGDTVEALRGYPDPTGGRKVVWEFE